jgi:hypothetical protein
VIGSRRGRVNTKDFIVNRVLDYSNQQFSMTFVSPLIRDRAHFFVNYEGEREPQTYRRSTDLSSR